MICIMAGILIAVALYSVNRQKLFMESCSKELKASLLQAQEVKCDLEEMMLNTINMSRELVDDLERRIKIEAEPVPSVLFTAQNMLLEHGTNSQLTSSEVQSDEIRAEDPSTTVVNPKPWIPEKAAGPKLFEPKPGTGSGMKTIPAAVFNSRPQFPGALKHELPESRTDSNAACSQRVHELAEELKASSKELLNICRQLGLPVNHHMKVLSSEQVDAIKAQWFFGEQVVVQSKQSHSSFQPEIVHASSLSSEKVGVYHGADERGQQFSLDEIKQAHPYLAVRTLSEQGYDQKEIARILGRGQSEINLILNLTKRKMASNA